MNYFLTNKIVYINSGIEHAQNKRLKMFKRGGLNAKIVTHNFLLNGHEYLSSLDLNDEDVVNLYDFFGGTESFPTHTLTFEDLAIPEDYTVEHLSDKFEYLIRSEDRLVMKIGHGNDEQKIGSLFVYDKEGHPIRKNYYDSRGFMAASLLMGLDGHKLIQQHFKPDGTLFMEVFFEAHFRDIEHATAIRLVNYQGRDYTFVDYNQLISFFYDQLNLLNPKQPSVFISDRSNMTDAPMIAMRTKAYKIEQFHINHYDERATPEDGRITSYFLRHKNWLQQVDALSVASQKQKRDIERRIPNVPPIAAIPVGAVPEKQINAERVPFDNRTPGSIVAVARPAVQKQLDHMIKAVAAAHAENASVHLDIYGVPAGIEGNGEWENLNQLIETNGWQSFIQFHGYVHNLSEILDHAQLSMLTSHNEGFGLALLEAMSHGVPLLAYNYNYGAEELISDGQNGHLIKQDDLAALSQTLIEMMNNPQRLAEMSSQSYEKAVQFSEPKILNQWKQLLNSFS